MNKVTFIDMEGVLVPEIWKFLAKSLSVSELKYNQTRIQKGLGMKSLRQV